MPAVSTAKNMTTLMGNCPRSGHGHRSPQPRARRAAIRALFCMTLSGLLGRGPVATSHRERQPAMRHPGRVQV